MTSFEGSDLGTVRNFLCKFRFGGVAVESTDVRIPFALLRVRRTSLLSFGRGVTSPSFPIRPLFASFDCQMQKKRKERTPIEPYRKSIHGRATCRWGAFCVSAAVAGNENGSGLLSALLLAPYLPIVCDYKRAEL